MYSPDSITQIVDDIQFKLMGPDKLFLSACPRDENTQRTRRVFCLIIAVLMKKAVFSLCGTDLFPEEEGRVFWGKVHQLSASLRVF